MKRILGTAEDYRRLYGPDGIGRRDRRDPGRGRKRPPRPAGKAAPAKAAAAKKKAAGEEEGGRAKEEGRLAQPHDVIEICPS